MMSTKRIALIAVIVLASLAWSAVPPSVARPVEQAVARPYVETVLSNTPGSSGVTIQLDLPAERFHDVPLVDRPGQPNRIGGTLP